MRSRMEMHFIDSHGQARKTGVGAVMDTDAETYAAFLSAKRLDVDGQKADFLLDYYNRRGDLSDTIGITCASFERITGRPVLSEAEYLKIDADFWRDMRETAGEPESRHIKY